MDMLLISVPIILIAIVTHEVWGHQLYAEKIAGMKPAFVAIGIPIVHEFRNGRKINTIFYTWEREGKIPVVFSYLMIGGGVGFNDRDYYAVGNYWRKVLMILAGPAVNIAISLVVVTLFSHIGMAWGLVSSYELFTLEVIKNIFSPAAVEQAVFTHGFIAITQNLSLLTIYWKAVALFALWNVSIGVINMLPIPGLDGGQILGLTIINLVGERAIVPVKKISQAFCYLLIIATAGIWIWWIGLSVITLLV